MQTIVAARASSVRKHKAKVQANVKDRKKGEMGEKTFHLIQELSVLFARKLYIEIFRGIGGPELAS